MKIMKCGGKATLVDVTHPDDELVERRLADCLEAMDRVDASEGTSTQRQTARELVQRALTVLKAH